MLSLNEKLSEVQLLRLRATFHALPLFYLRTKILRTYRHVKITRHRKSTLSLEYDQIRSPSKNPLSCSSPDLTFSERSLPCGVSITVNPLFEFSQEEEVIYPDRFATQYICMCLRGVFVYFIWDYRRCHFLTASFSGSSLFLLSFLPRPPLRCFSK